MALRVVLLALLLGGCRPSSSAVLGEARADDTLPGVAVVELFTSEGCSSCPPADHVLADVARGNPSVYALSFHVDYWDDLGWRDPFSAPDFTARQQAYARAFGASGLYTPQMVVGGTEAFVGSDRARARASIAKALSHGASVRVAVSARPAGSDHVAVTVEAPGAPADAIVSVALVAHEETSDVRAGENAGSTLHHTNVVRAFAAASSRRTPLDLVVPPALSRAGAEVIAFVQRRSDGSGPMPILGAGRANVPD